MFVDSSIISKPFPTMEEYFKVLKLADDDDIKTRDVRPLMSVLKRMKNSGRIKGDFGTRRMGVASFEWELKAHDSARQSEADLVRQRLAQLINYIIRRHDQTVAFGASLIELAYQPVTFIPSVLKFYQPEEFEKSGEEQVAIIKDNGGKISKTIIAKNSDPKYLIDFDSETERGGIMRSIAEAALLKREQTLEWSELNKRLKGIVVALIDMEKINRTYDETEKKAELDNVVKAAKGAGKHNYLVASDAVKTGFERLADAAAGPSFKELVNNLQGECSVAILGQENTQRLPNSGGSRAALQVLNLIRVDILLSDILRIEDLINDQLLVFDYTNVYKKTGVEPEWYFKFKWDVTEDCEANSRVLVNASKFNLPLKKSEVYEKIGYEVPSQSDEVLQLSATPPAIPGF